MIAYVLELVKEHQEWLFGSSSVALLIVALFSNGKKSEKKEKNTNLSLLELLKARTGSRNFVILGASLFMMLLAFGGAKNSGNVINSGDGSQNINAVNSDVVVKR
ncbi:hypothetical protein [Roseibium sp.]|uniref:hypothetical protein n=1 Tax=Roseibium sp. TaxID=1936156 RepID=UPI003D0AA902